MTIQKIIREVKRAVFIPIAFVISLIVIVLRPLFFIRFAEFRSERIAHFTLEPEMYLCMLDLSKNKKQSLDIFYYNRNMVCNTQLLKMWESHFHTITWHVLFCYVKSCLLSLPFGSNHVIRFLHHSNYQKLVSQNSPHISFSPLEETLGQSILNEQKINGDYVCLHARDSFYLNQTMPEQNWTGHDYRDVKIENYLFALDQLTQRDLTCLRMAAVIEKPLLTQNQKIIDYAYQFRSDFMDIYLCSHCKFAIMYSGGLYGIPMIFKRPMVGVNLIPLHSYIYFGGGDVFIPKLLRKRSTNKIMSFRESISLIGKDITQLIKENSIELIENTPEDIAEVVVEMNDRLNGVWKESQEAIELQKSFWAIVETSKFKRTSGVKIGAEFLKKYKNLL
tara:strand:- start:346 stop:1518 length:1173 start_codon:yes stop_codon:yes gene_type:complete